MHAAITGGEVATEKHLKRARDLLRSTDRRSLARFVIEIFYKVYRFDWTYSRLGFGDDIGTYADSFRSRSG